MQIFESFEALTASYYPKICSQYECFPHSFSQSQATGKWSFSSIWLSSLHQDPLFGIKQILMLKKVIILWLLIKSSLPILCKKCGLKYYHFWTKIDILYRCLLGSLCGRSLNMALRSLMVYSSIGMHFMCWASTDKFHPKGLLKNDVFYQSF